MLHKLKFPGAREGQNNISSSSSRSAKLVAPALQMISAKPPRLWMSAQPGGRRGPGCSDEPGAGRGVGTAPRRKMKDIGTNSANSTQAGGASNGLEFICSSGVPRNCFFLRNMKSISKDMLGLCSQPFRMTPFATAMASARLSR